MDEVEVVRAVLASMGVTDYDPKVATLLAEYLRRESSVVWVGSGLIELERAMMQTDSPAMYFLFPLDPQ